MQFTELTNVSPEIIRATQAMGFTDMTEIQEKGNNIVLLKRPILPSQI